jgi:predicted ribosome quality control (RQC) complex YloA/Tae2 family protein
MLEEQFRNDLMYVIETYSKKGLTIGSIFYIIKDVFNEISRTYNDFLHQEFEKQKIEQEKEEKEEEE